MRSTYILSLVLLVAVGSTGSAVNWESQASSQTPLAFSSLGRPSSWYLSVEATAFSALRDSGFSEFYLEDLGSDIQYGPLFNSADSEQFTAAPRITLGKAVGDGWSVQTTYWSFESSSSNGFSGLTPDTFADFGLGLTSDAARTRAYTFDVEAARQFCAGATWMTATLGCRYGLIKHTDSSSAAGLANGQNPDPDFVDLFVMSSQSSSGFNGTGLTYSLSGIRPTAGPWSLYAGGRLSNLFGTNHAAAQTGLVATGPSGFTAVASQASSRDIDHLFIAETQVGVMWNRCLKQTGGRLFARAGFEYQYWNSPNFGADSFNEGLLIGSSYGYAYAEPNDVKTHFVGLSIGAGYAW